MRLLRRTNSSSYTGKLEASGAQSEIVGLKRDPDRNNKKNDRENDDNKSKQMQSLTKWGWRR